MADTALDFDVAFAAFADEYQQQAIAATEMPRPVPAAEPEAEAGL